MKDKIDELKDAIIRNLRNQVTIQKQIIKSKKEQIIILKEKVETLDRLAEKLTEIEGVGYWKPKGNKK